MHLEDECIVIETGKKEGKPKVEGRLLVQIVFHVQRDAPMSQRSITTARALKLTHVDVTCPPSCSATVVVYA